MVADDAPLAEARAAARKLRWEAELEAELETELEAGTRIFYIIKLNMGRSLSAYLTSYFDRHSQSLLTHWPILSELLTAVLTARNARPQCVHVTAEDAMTDRRRRRQ